MQSHAIGAPMSGHALLRKAQETLLRKSRSQALDIQAISTVAHAPIRPGDTPRAIGANQLQRTYGNLALVRAHARNGSIQPKLSVGPVDDAYEQEAGREASAFDQAAHTPPGGAAIQRAPGNDPGMLEGGAVGPSFEVALNQDRGAGNPLPASTRNVMDGHFKADFGSVRVHDNPQADQLSRSISADAFTTGRDIFFRQGVYNPSSQQGQSVLAHELTHVVQQGAAGSAQVQRLTSAKDFKKSTSLTLRDGKSSGFFAGIIGALQTYEGKLASAPAPLKISHLKALSKTLAEWDKKRGAKSSRRKHVTALKNEIDLEVGVVSQRLSTLQGDEFKSGNEASAENRKYGDMMNQIDEIVYNFAIVEAEDGTEMKESGGEFIAVFKENLDVDPMGSQQDNKKEGRGGHRGAGIPKNKPEFAGRNLAMQALDKLLGGNVVPKTFLAEHDSKQGFIMEKVQGKTMQQLEKAATDEDGFDDDAEMAFLQSAVTNPLVRKNLSTIYLLDQICAQVDRHSGNYMVVIENGVIKGAKAIDNDLAFGKDVPMQDMLKMTGASAKFRRFGTAGLLMDELNEIDRPFAQRIVQVADQPQLVRDALKGLITAEEMDATLKRLDTLADFLRPMLTNNDPILKTKWE